jgi:hypothetical protein
MHIHKLLSSALLGAASAAFAAPDPYLYQDHSSPALIDTAGAMAIWKAQVDDSMRVRLRKLYPVADWGFISQVQGGFTPEKVCVVTARAIIVPRMRGSRLVFQPKKSATAFGSQAGASDEQCRELAAVKLKEAVLGIRSAVMEP